MLKKTQKIFILKEKIKKTISYAITLQTSVRRYKLFQQNLYQRLQMMFDREKNFMINYLHSTLKKKKLGKGNKVLVGEISDIS